LFRLNITYQTFKKSQDHHLKDQAKLKEIQKLRSKQAGLSEPLSVANQRKLDDLKPDIDKIQEQCKDDQASLLVEIWKLYDSRGVSDLILRI